MPRNALIYDHVDLVFRVETLAAVLTQLASGNSIEAAAHTRGVRPVRSTDVIAPAWLPRGRRLP
jgi:hypothetical protein